MPDLRLCKLPDRSSVRMKILLPVEVHQSLLDYGALYAEVYGKTVPEAELLPAILSCFFDGDKAFASWRRQRRVGAS
jgi:hypothetical protein